MLFIDDGNTFVTSRFCVVMKCRCLAAKLRGRRLNLVWLAALGLTLGLLRAAAATLPANLPDPGELENSFRNPPATARPWVYGFWVDGNVSREGITADLEAMQRVGIGGILLMDVTQNMPKGPVRFNSDSWHQLFQHLVAEAARLGLQVDMHNAPGWSGSGGPWVTPEFAMQQLVYSKTNVSGPGHIAIVLPSLPEIKGYSRNVVTLAFPTIVGDGRKVPGFSPKITAKNAPGFDGARLLDNAPATFVTLPPPTAKKPQVLDLEFAQPFEAERLVLSGRDWAQEFDGILQTSDDGNSFRTIRNFRSTSTNLTVTFEQTPARHFRIAITTSQGKALEFSSLELFPIHRIELYKAKSGLSRGPWPLRERLSLPDYSAVHLKDVLDLSTNTDESGRLNCDLPKGDWTILRFGTTLMGTENHPAPAGGLGLECDKLSAEAIERHFAAFVGKLATEAGKNVPGALSSVHIDSWEVGFQNWTPKFLQEFKRLRGYGAVPYLPAMTGRFVESPEISERFLWDVRRTIADLVAENYAQHLAELAHKRGMKLTLEGYDNGPFDNLLYASKADIPMGEFWAETEDFSRFYNSKSMASAAHAYGKPIVAVEAFTSYPATGKWQNHPYSLKALADAGFCVGLNHFVIHTYTHQPWLDRQPGMTTGMWGPHYERTETWWEQTKPWHEYLARCQYLLQQGRFVADICYVTAEGAFTPPPPEKALSPPLPTGFDYDVVPPEVVLQRMNCNNAQFILPDAMSYRVLVLPQVNTMTPELLGKIKALIQAGGTVIGPKPVKSPSLSNFPACDLEVAKLAGEIWGDCDGKKVKEHSFGAGKIVWGKSLEQTLSEMKASPDFVQETPTTPFALNRIHRSIGTLDLYFVANSNAHPVSAECAFRVTGKRPEFWYADTGNIVHPAEWIEKEGHTTLNVELAPSGSVFVVFKPTTEQADPIVRTSFGHNQITSTAQLSVQENGALLLASEKSGSYQVTTRSGKVLNGQIPSIPEPLQISGPWDLDFPPNLGAPAHVQLPQLLSWSLHENPGVKYFSGTATYRRTVTIPPEYLAENSSLFLDLGNVQVIAEVEWNGQNLGTLWKPPFSIDITPAAKSGENSLIVKVVNLWPNRLIGDQRLPEDCLWGPPEGPNGSPLAEWPAWFLEGKPSPSGRIAFTTWKAWEKDSPLLESGLLGPVVLRGQKKTILK